MTSQWNTELAWLLVFIGCFDSIALYVIEDVNGLFAYSLQRVPVIHLFNSWFKEQIGDTSGARASLQQCESESASNFVENVKLKANMEKRMVCPWPFSYYYGYLPLYHSIKKLEPVYWPFLLVFQNCQGNFDAASNVYIDAIEMAATKKMSHALPILYVHFSRHVYMVGDLCRSLSPQLFHLFKKFLFIFTKYFFYWLPVL